MLSLALTRPEQLDHVLNFAENPLVQLAEFGLVFGRAVHMFGGLRLMAMEWLPWSDSQKTLAAGSLAISFLISCIFFLQAI
jgi:fumarate reductase subunit D